MRIVLCTVLVTLLSTGSLLAASCCPAHRVGTEAASVCPACGEATLLGLSIPLASALGIVVAASVGGALFLKIRRFRIRRFAVVGGI